MVDGGLDYCRRSCNGDEVDLSKHDDESHAVQSHILEWGTYGINGDQPMRWVKLALMETAHIEAVLKLNVNPVHRRCMEKELRIRSLIDE